MGVSARTLSGNFRGPLNPHEHRPKVDGKQHPVWGSIFRLKTQGLLTFVPHLFEGDRLGLDGGSARTGIVTAAEIQNGRYRILKAGTPFANPISSEE